MTEKNKHAAAYLSWRSAWRMRCCPPDYLLYGEDTKELAEHLQSCPWCREERDTGNIFKFPVRQGMTEKKEKAEPEPGQLWSLKQSLGSWGPKGCYYSPPLVVIVAVTATSVTVLQSYGDMDMAGADDLPFQTDLIGFSQPWNRYSLRIDDLDTCYGLVFKNPQQELFTPENVSEQSAETGSLFWFFRQMEVETGYFFASQAIPALMAAYEEIHVETSTDKFTVYNDDHEKMTGELLNLGLVFSDPPLLQATAMDLLFNVQAPDDLLPLAAADNKAASDYALSFTVEDEKIIAVETVGVQITAWRRDGSLVHISGNITEIAPGNLQIFFRLRMKNRHFEPLPGDYGIKADFFWALFHVEDTDLEEGEFIVRIITD